MTSLSIFRLVILCSPIGALTLVIVGYYGKLNYPCKSLRERPWHLVINQYVCCFIPPRIKKVVSSEVGFYRYCLREQFRHEFFLVRKATMDVKTVDIYVLRSESVPHSLIHEPEKERACMFQNA